MQTLAVVVVGVKAAVGLGADASVGGGAHHAVIVLNVPSTPWKPRRRLTHCNRRASNLVSGRTAALAHTEA